MFAKMLICCTTLALAAWSGPSYAQSNASTTTEALVLERLSQGRSQTGGQSYGDRDRGGRSGFYSYPRHRHVDGSSSSSSSLDRQFSPLSSGTSPWCGNCHGSPYYGPDYGAPYFGGGYYDRGVYYRERRDR